MTTTPLKGVQTLTQPITRLDQSDILQLVSDYVSGSSARQLSRDWNVHRTTVMDHLERHNIPRRPHVRKLTDTQLREAAELYQAGTSLAKLGTRYHVDPQTVSKELKRAGVTVRRPGPWLEAEQSDQRVSTRDAVRVLGSTRSKELIELTRDIRLQVLTRQTKRCRKSILRGRPERQSAVSVRDLERLGALLQHES